MDRRSLMIGGYNLLATIPAEEAFRPLAEGNCPLVRS